MTRVCYFVASTHEIHENSKFWKFEVAKKIAFQLMITTFIIFIYTNIGDNNVIAKTRQHYRACSYKIFNKQESPKR